MSNETRLEPCPFCGDAAEMNPDGDAYCPDAKCAGFVGARIDLWNRRPPPPDAGELPEGCSETRMYGKRHYMNLHQEDIDCRELGCVPVELHPIGTRSRLRSAPDEGARYRLLENGETIEKTDEFYRPGTNSWVGAYGGPGGLEGVVWREGCLPVRRALRAHTKQEKP